MGLRTEKIYTDASVMEHLKSSAYAVFFGPGDSRNYSAPIPWTKDVVYCETVAVGMAIVKVSNTKIIPDTCYHIFTDCDGAVLNFENHFQNKGRNDVYAESWTTGALKLVDKCVAKLREMRCRISVEWVKGHAKLHGNIMADKMARETALKNASQFMQFFRAPSHNLGGKAPSSGAGPKAMAKKAPTNRLASTKQKPARPRTVSSMPIKRPVRQTLLYCRSPMLRQRLPYGPAGFPEIPLVPELPLAPRRTVLKNLRETPPEFFAQAEHEVARRELELKTLLSRFPVHLRKHMRDDFYKRLQVQCAYVRKYGKLPPSPEPVPQPAWGGRPSGPRSGSQPGSQSAAQPAAQPVPQPAPQSAPQPKQLAGAVSGAVVTPAEFMLAENKYESDDECMTLMVKKADEPLQSPDGKKTRVPSSEISDSDGSDSDSSDSSDPSDETDYSDDDDCAVILSKASHEILTSEEMKLLEGGGNDDEEHRMKIISEASDRAYANWKEQHDTEEDLSPLFVDGPQDDDANVSIEL